MDNKSVAKMRDSALKSQPESNNQGKETPSLAGTVKTEKHLAETKPSGPDRLDCWRRDLMNHLKEELVVVEELEDTLFRAWTDVHLRSEQLKKQLENLAEREVETSGPIKDQSSTTTLNPPSFLEPSQDKTAAVATVRFAVSPSPSKQDGLFPKQNIVTRASDDTKNKNKNKKFREVNPQSSKGLDSRKRSANDTSRVILPRGQTLSTPIATASTIKRQKLRVDEVKQKVTENPAEEKASTSNSKHEPTPQSKSYFKCSHCDVCYSRKDTLLQHQQLKHGLAMSQGCSMCNERFATVGALVTHEHSVHSLFSCFKCGARFKSRKSVTAHKRQCIHGCGKSRK